MIKKCYLIVKMIISLVYLKRHINQYKNRLIYFIMTDNISSDILSNIFSFFFPLVEGKIININSNYNFEEIRNIAYFHRYFYTRIVDILTYKKFSEKYNKYNDDLKYLSEMEGISFRKRDTDILPSMLYDALLTSVDLPFAKSSFNTYSDEIEKDIIKMIELFPESINCTIGNLRCREYVTPLFAACVNINIPMKIVKLIFENDNTEKTIEVNGRKVSILSDIINLWDSIPKNRLNEIKNLFHNSNIII